MANVLKGAFLERTVVHELSEQVAELRKALQLAHKMMKGTDVEHRVVTLARPRLTIGKHIQRVLEDTRPHRKTL